MRWPALFVLLAACSGRETASGHLAVGWQGPMPTTMGPCTTELGAKDAVQNTGFGPLIAVSAGTTTLSCRDGNLALTVVQPTKLTILPVEHAAKGATIILAAAAATETETLALGDAQLGWTLPPGLRQIDRCRHGMCLRPSSVRVVIDESGTFDVNAQFGALSATMTIVVP